MPFDWGPLLGGGPLFMGILNVTPDSFSDGGRFITPERALDHARDLVDQGARMLDLGAESTRPGAEPVGEDAEWSRLEPVIQALRSELPSVPLSLDTRHAAVASRGLAAGVAVLNDVTGFQDPELLDLATRHGCGLIAMRSRTRGGALVMPPYQGEGATDDGALLQELAAVRDRLRNKGIPDGRVLLDPGFGFGTTFPEDHALWRGLQDLPARLEWPVDRFCLGVSRKRFLAARAGTPALPPDQRDALTRAAHREAQAWGYRVFRTHAIG